MTTPAPHDPWVERHVVTPDEHIARLNKIAARDDPNREEGGTPKGAAEASLAAQHIAELRSTFVVCDDPECGDCADQHALALCDAYEALAAAAREFLRALYDSGFLPDFDERTVDTKARRCTAAHHALRALLGDAPSTPRPVWGWAPDLDES